MLASDQNHRKGQRVLVRTIAGLALFALLFRLLVLYFPYMIVSSLAGSSEFYFPNENWVLFLLLIYVMAMLFSGKLVWFLPDRR